jgi:hypothetical protein
MMKRTLLTACLLSALAGVGPAALFQVACASESEARAAYLMAMTVVLVFVAVPVVVVATAERRGIARPLRQPAWLTFLGGPVLMSALAFLTAWGIIAGRPWAEVQAGRAGAVVFALGNLVLFGLAARRRSGRWARAPLAGMIVGVCSWIALFWSRRYTDELTANLAQDVVLFPIWILTFVPSWVTWTFQTSG